MTETGHPTLLPSTAAMTETGHSLPLRVSVVLLYSIIFLPSLVGNVLVLYIIYKRSHIRTTISYLFVNLAVADLIITVFAIPESAAYYFRNGTWLGGVEGDILCRIVRFLFVIAIVASLITLTAMTLDRFIAVVYPLRASKRHSPKKSTTVIWLSSTLFMFLRLLTYSNSSGDCSSDWSLLGVEISTGNTISYVIYFVILFILPLTLIVVLNSIMCTKLRHHQSPGIIEVHTTRRLLDRNRKVIKLLVSIVMVFTLCWFPVAIMHLVWALNKAAPEYVMFLFFWCGHSHSAITPWIYIYLNTQFRGAFLEIIGRRPPNMSVSGYLATSARSSNRRCNSVVTCRETVL